MIYIDSSVLLAVYLGQPQADRARALLRQDPVRVSSWLLAIEVPVVLRRALDAERDGELLRAGYFT